MNTTDNASMDDGSSADLVSVTELQNQLNDLLKQLSPERLQVLTDFAAYLANAESETATQELLAIPGLLERVKQNQATPKAQYTRWRSLRSDV
jgi:predicted RecB family endonuclease